MEEVKQESHLAKLTLDNHHEHYRVYIEIEPGADIPPNLRELIISIAREDSRKLSFAEIELIENVFSTDINSLEHWEQLEVKKALVMSNIGIRLKSGPSLVFNGVFQLPKEFAGFTGRKKELDDLNKYNNKPKAITQKIAGLGGVGKTQLLNYYARLKVIEGCYQWIVWLRGGKVEEEEGFSSQFADLASRLCIYVKGNNEEKLKELVYQQLVKRGEGILIIDGVNDYIKVKMCLPEKFNIYNIRVLISSQDTLNWGNEIEKIQLGSFKSDEAFDYIRKEIEQKKYNEEEAKLLAETLYYFPLALTQAIAYINNNPISIKAYIESFKAEKENQKKLLNYPPFNTDDHQETVYATMMLSLKQINDSSVIKILQICSHLAAEVPIDVKLLQFWIVNNLELNEKIEKIKKYSLMYDSNITNHIEIHQIVQAIIMLDMEEFLSASITIEVGKTLDNFKSNQKQTFTGSFENICYLPHLKKIGSLLRNALKVADIRKAAAFVDYRIGEVYLMLGKYIDAKNAFMEAWRVFCDVDNNSYQVAMVERRLAEVMIELNEYIKAQRYNQSAIYKLRLLNKDEEITLCEMSNALVKMRLGNYVEAKTLYESLLQNFKQKYGETDLYVLQCEFNLGVINCILGEVLGTKKYFNEKIRECEERYGKDALIVGECHYGFANILMDLDEKEEGLLHLEKARSIFNKVYGEGHPKVVQCNINIALLKIESDDVTSLSILEDILPKLILCYGKTHVAVARCESYIGVVYVKKENYNLANTYLLSAIKIFESSGVNINKKIRIAACFFNLGISSFNIKMLDDARIYFEKCLNLLDNKNADKIAECEKYLADICFVKKDLISSLKHRESEYMHLKSHFGSENYKVTRCQLQLASNYLEVGNFEIAKNHLEEVFEILIDYPIKDYETIARCKMNLGIVEIKFNNFIVAKTNFTESLQYLEENQIKSDALYAECKFNLGVAFLYLDQYEDAKNNIEYALSKFLLNPDENNLKIAKCYTNLGIYFYKIFKYNNSEKYYEKAHEINLSLYGEKHIETALNIFHLSILHKKIGRLTRALNEMIIIHPIYKSYFGDNHNSTIDVSKKIDELKKQLLFGQEILKKIPSDSPAQGLRRLVATGDFETLKLLLHTYADYIDVPDDNIERGYTALHLAYFYQKQFLFFLIMCGARYDIKDRKLKTVVDYAIENNDSEFILILCEVLMELYSIDKTDVINIERVIYSCAEFNNSEALKLFLRLTDFDINRPNKDSGMTALQHAVMNSNIECVKLLIDAGADARIEDSNGKTAIDLAENKNDLISILTINDIVETSNPN